MLKALLKKQMLEFAYMWFKDKKTGKMRAGKSLAGFIILFGFVFLTVIGSFAGVDIMLAEAFIPAGLDWLYFAIGGTLALMLGVFGDVFNSYASLYLAKDNELLLSMPVTPTAVLFVRMISVYLMGFIYTALAFLPAAAVYMVKADLTVKKVLFPLVLLFVIGVAVLVLTCVLGYVVAEISKRIKGKAAVTVIFSVAFIGIYYFFSFRMGYLMELITLHPEAVGEKVKGSLYPLYVFGLAASGDVKSMLIVIAVIAAACALTYFVLSKTFIRITTTKTAAKKAEYKEKTAKVSGVSAALLKRELKHFSSSPTYMLNCGLGIIMMVILAAASVIKADTLREALAMMTVQVPELAKLPAAAIAAAVCLILSMNEFTAPSVSLEGKGIWIAQSLPIPAAEVLKAKEKMHVLLNVIPAEICAAVLCVVLRVSLPSALAAALFIAVFTVFCADFGLIMDLRSPNLVWTNENVPVKQNMSVLFSMLVGFGICIVFAAASYFGMALMPPAVICLVFSALLAAAAFLLRRRVLTWGADVFEGL